MADGRRKRHQQLPSSGPAREALRRHGQFWTPDWIASAMVNYVQPKSTGHLFDPAVGMGAFFRACKREISAPVELFGCDIDPKMLGAVPGLAPDELRKLELRDFVLDPPRRKFLSITANPPYIRHHRLPRTVKDQLRLFARQLLGETIDGRAGLHVYFLLRALSLLAPGGRLAFILPADTFEGVFSGRIWAWILSRYSLEVVITFSEHAAPFPGVDTNAVIVFIRNAAATRVLTWARCTMPDAPLLAEWVKSGLSGMFPGDVLVRQVDEALRTGLTRPPRTLHAGSILGDFATVVRGIATGANDFFFLTEQRVRELAVPAEFLVRAVGRTRDVNGEVLTGLEISRLAARGRPTYLLSIAPGSEGSLPPRLAEYVKSGELAGLGLRALIATRKPWYKMERRSVPDFLFAYLGRRNARFIKNEARVVPLTGFLCVYSKSRKPGDIEKLWQVLRHPKTTDNLKLVGKSYGSGAIKVEPRALERLPLPADVLEAIDLIPAAMPRQSALFPASLRA